MNELNGPYVVIVLGVREGRGFDFLQQPLLIEASLKGHRIEADPVEPGPCPAVCTELVWETEKKEVRKLRSSHVPLRIDCYTMNSNSHYREKIGFILLSLRSAAAITGTAALALEPKWHRLVSVPSEYRALRPELALTLSVRDRVCAPLDPMVSAMPNMEQVTLGEATTVIPIIYLDGGYIQIGENSPNNQKFVLSFLVGTASNLDLLLNEELVFNSSREKFYLALSILGLTINTKCIKNLHEPVVLNEKIVFKLLTSLETLKLFLDEFKTVPIQFHHGAKVLASADISLKELFATDVPCKHAQVSEFFPKDSNSTQHTKGRIPQISTETILDVFVVSTSLKSSDQPKEVSLSISTDSAPGCKDSPDEALNASGDQIRPNTAITENSTNAGKSIPSMEDVSVQTTPRESICSKSSLALLKNGKKSLSPVRFSDVDAVNYRLFNLMIVFRSITWRKRLNIEGFRFKFQHPKVQQTLIINCELEKMRPNEIMVLEDICCIMHFLSTEENIKNLIAMYPPSVALQSYDNNNLADEFVLYTKLMLKEGVSSCDYFAVLNTVDNSDDLLCDLNIEMSINELSPSFTMKYDASEFNLDPIILDDWLALKTVKDLEEWKEKQEILFKDNLKRLECEKLELLQAEWNVKRIELETKLQQGMEKCKVLSEELSATANELRIKKRSLDEKLLVSPDSRENIEIKVTQMLEEEMNKNVQRIETEKHKLLQKIDQLSEEKITLEEKIRVQDTELEEMRKTTLTKEQTAGLLQELRQLEEKFQQALLEKTFFKQQWHTALKEVHALKAEDNRQIRQDIRRKKEELSQLSLEGVDSGECISDVDNDISLENILEMESYFY